MGERIVVLTKVDLIDLNCLGEEENREKGNFGEEEEEKGGGGEKQRKLEGIHA